MVKICEVVDGCEDCPKYGDDCDGEEMTEHTDYISRADAMGAVQDHFNANGFKGYDDGQKMMDRIKALPSADAVSREWYDDAVKANHELAFTDLPDIPRYYYEKVVGNMAHEINMLKEQLESADAVQGWIPVEEQPPAFPCLVCDANGNQPSVPLGIVTITDEEHGEWHIDGRLWDTKIFFKGEWCSQTGYGNRIIAWMPLPKPYKGGDDE